MWGAAILLRLYVELIGLCAIFAPVLAPFANHSPRQITPLDVLLAWLVWASVAERFEDFIRYRRDPLLPRLLDLSRLTSPETLQRFFRTSTHDGPLSFRKL